MVAAATAFVAAPAAAAPPKNDKPGKGSDNRNNNTSEKLRQAARPRTRCGTSRPSSPSRTPTATPARPARPGYDASRTTSSQQLTAAGYTPQVQEFDFPFFQDLSTLTVNGTAIATGSFTFAGSGTLTVPRSSRST
jgi:hypothetical protein